MCLWICEGIPAIWFAVCFVHCLGKYISSSDGLSHGSLFFRETGRFSRDTRHICTSIGLAEWQTSIFVSREWKALPRQPYDRSWTYLNSNAHDWVNFNISARFGTEKLLRSLEKRMNFALEIHARWIPIQESTSVGCDDLEIWSVFRIFIVTNGGIATVRHIQPIRLNRNDASNFAMSPWVTFDSGRYAPTILWESRMRYYPPFRQPRTKEALLNGAKISVLTATELFLTVIILGNRHASASTAWHLR